MDWKHSVKRGGLSIVSTRPAGLELAVFALEDEPMRARVAHSTVP